MPEASYPKEIDISKINRKIPAPKEAAKKKTIPEMNIKNVGRNQALKSEAFRESRHVDPTRVINFRAHNHASFIFIFQSIGLLCTVSIPIYLKIRIFIRLKKKQRKRRTRYLFPNMRKWNRLNEEHTT